MEYGGSRVLEGVRLGVSISRFGGTSRYPSSRGGNEPWRYPIRQSSAPRRPQHRTSSPMLMAFILLVKPNGSKLWRWKYRFGGKEKLMALGIQIMDVKSAAWLSETTVLSMPGASVDFQALVSSSSLFPFAIQRMLPEQLAESGRLDVTRHGLSDVLVRARS